MTDASQSRSLVLLTLGTEIGCRMTLGDLVLDSPCGHSIIDCGADARVCHCGHRGHLDAYCSQTALLIVRESTRRRPQQLALPAAGGRRRGLDCPLLAAEAEAGDPLAMEIVLDTARYLAVGIVNLMHTVDPDGVLLAGSMTFGGGQSS